MPFPTFKPGDRVLVLPVVLADPIVGLGTIVTYVDTEVAIDYLVLFDAPIFTDRFPEPRSDFWVAEQLMIRLFSQEILDAFPDLQTR